MTAVSDGTSANATGGFGLTDDSGTAVKQDLGKTIQVAGDGNVTTTAGDGKITVRFEQYCCALATKVLPMVL